MGKTGRNEKCPCGSGRKYKHCCGATDGNILPFPGGVPSDEGMSWQESRGTPNQARDILHQIRSELGDIEFSSLDEMNEYTRSITGRINQAGLDDFLGLSPAQMHDISSTPLSENQDYLTLSGDITEDDIPGIPFLSQTLWLMKYLNTEGPVKLTAAGYLPPSLALSWFDEAFRQYTDEVTLRIRPVRRESDDPDMVWVRAILKKMKLLHVRKGQLSISSKGKAFLNAGVPNQFQQSFYFLADEWDWSTQDNLRFQVSPFHQTSLPFFLHVLNQQGVDGLAQSDAERIFYAAFPHIFDPQEDDSFIYYLVLAEPARNFTEPLGLSDRRVLDSDLRKVVPTELFRRAICWGDWTRLV